MTMQFFVVLHILKLFLCHLVSILSSILRFLLRKVQSDQVEVLTTRDTVQPDLSASFHENQVVLIVPNNEMNSSKESRDPDELFVSIPLVVYPEIEPSRFQFLSSLLIAPKEQTSSSTVSTNGKKFACFVDGSYSMKFGFGHSGFRSSDGFQKVSRIFPQNRRSGSTESEVWSAFLAIKYAIKTNQKSLLIYTDNTKVEQLIKRPRARDRSQNREFADVLKEFREKHGDGSINVARIKGHTNREQQNVSAVDNEFAKIDRKVRSKTRKYISRILWNQLPVVKETHNRSDKTVFCPPESPVFKTKIFYRSRNFEKSRIHG